MQQPLDVYSVKAFTEKDMWQSLLLLRYKASIKDNILLAEIIEFFIQPWLVTFLGKGKTNKQTKNKHLLHTLLLNISILNTKVVLLHEAKY